MALDERRTPSLGAQSLMFVATSVAMVGNYYVYDSIAPVAELLGTGLGLSDTQIGTLNAIYSAPNIFMVLIAGVLVDRFSARSVTLGTAAICFLGALLTAAATDFATMAAGRLLFGLGAEAMIVAVTVALAQWFAGRHFALLFALNLSLARFGSYLADRSPSFAADLYAQGWQPPLYLATAFAAAALVGSAVYWWIDRREAARGTLALAPKGERFERGQLLRFRREYWYIVALCVAFYAVLFPFRSTFAIKYFQHAHGLTLAEAGEVNSYVFLAAIFASPVFGFLVDRVGRHAQLLVAGSLLVPLSFLVLGTAASLAVPTVMLGVAFSLVPAVLWPAVARYVAPAQLGTAYGLMTMLQNVGLVVANLAVGVLNDLSGAGAASPAGYGAMLWFFGVVGLAGFVCAVLLGLRGRPQAFQGGEAR